ncbi:MAG: hypothetical protein ACOY4U_11285 [Pseudomonadota bacterium]
MDKAKLVIAALFGCMLTSGCANRHNQIMACAVSAAWQCPTSSVSIQPMGASIYKASGCGHEETYACKGPVDGCTTDGPEPKSLNTRACIDAYSNGHELK